MKSLVTLYCIGTADITVTSGLVGPMRLGLTIHTGWKKAEMDADIIDNGGHQGIDFSHQTISFSK